MLIAFYLFIIPLGLVIFYVSVKFFLHRQEILHLSTNAFIDESDIPDNRNLAYEMVLDFVDQVKSIFTKNTLSFFHWLLHFIVIFLKIISEITNFLYVLSRDFFLETAVKEKDAVSKFWSHLKEYKKEKEEENQDK